MARCADSKPIFSATQDAEAGRSQVLGCLCHKASSNQFSLGNLVRPWLKIKRAKGLVSLLRVGNLSSLCRVLYPALERKGGETENVPLTDQGTHVFVPLGRSPVTLPGCSGSVETPLIHSGRAPRELRVWSFALPAQKTPSPLVLGRALQK